MLIMYDEPFAGLDPISLSIVGELIRKLNDALGATSIVVTHDVQESLKIVDYVYFMSDGKIVAEGTAEEIKHSERALRAPVRLGRDGRPGAFPLSGQCLPRGNDGAARRADRSVVMTPAALAAAARSPCHGALSGVSVSPAASCC